MPYAWMLNGFAYGVGETPRKAKQDAAHWLADAGEKGGAPLEITEEERAAILSGATELSLDTPPGEPHIGTRRFVESR